MNKLRSEVRSFILENPLTSLRSERDAAYEVLWDHAKRARIGIKVFYGDDSSQYEMVGGTRLPLVS